MAKGGLGGGLDNLFGDNFIETESAKTLKITEIERNKQQPRKTFDDENLEKLADSIRVHGILQPLLVRPFNDTYQLVAGERRYRAAKLAGLSEVPVTIKELSDLETAQIALIENIQREDLNPIEEAQGYKDLMEYGMTAEEIAGVIGKSRPFISNATRLLNLPEDVKKMLIDGILSVGHAKVLLSVEDTDLLRGFAKMCVSEKLSVRELEKLIAKAENVNENPNGQKQSQGAKSTYCKEVEYSLAERLGRKVKVDSGKDGAGKITLEFFDEKDLSELAEFLTGYNADDENPHIDGGKGKSYLDLLLEGRENS